LSSIDCEYDMTLNFTEVWQTPRDIASLQTTTADLNVYSGQQQQSQQSQQTQQQIQQQQQQQSQGSGAAANSLAYLSSIKR
jgi:hypothetical protein